MDSRRWGTAQLFTGLLIGCLLLSAAPVRGDIYQWEWIDPATPGSGRQASTTLCPDGAGVSLGAGADLAGLDLTQAYVDGSLAGANLTGTKLSDAAFTTTSSLEGATLVNAAIQGVTFVVEAIPTAAQLYSTASYQQRDLRGVTFEYRRQAISLDFTGQDLSGANFFSNLIRGSSFRGANLSGVDFSLASISGADFTDATIDGARFLGHSFAAEQLYQTASYQEGHLRDIEWSVGDLNGWNLSGMNLTGTSFSGCSLRGTDFRDSNVTWFTLSSAFWLVGADLRGTGVSTLEAPTYRDVRNVLFGDGVVRELRLESGESLVIRNHPTSVSVTGDATLAAGGLLEIVMDGNSWTSILGFDPTSLATLDGDLSLLLMNVPDPEMMLGTTFNLFDWPASGPQGQFAAIQTQPGYEWDTAALYTDGTVTLTAVPEPCSTALLLLGFAWTRARRPKCA